MTQTLGLFCGNTSEPEKFTRHGFLTGPVMRTSFRSAESITRDGLVGIYTNGTKDHIKKWHQLTSLPLPDCHSDLFPDLTYEIDQDFDEVVNV